MLLFYLGKCFRNFLLRFHLNICDQLYRCDWCRACFKGPKHQKVDFIGRLTSIFEKWRRLYASIDGTMLRFYESKSSVDVVESVRITDIKAVDIELSGIDRMAAKQSKSAFVEDSYTVIVTLISGDEIHIKYFFFYHFYLFTRIIFLINFLSDFLTR